MTLVRFSARIWNESHTFGIATCKHHAECSFSGPPASSQTPGHIAEPFTGWLWIQPGRTWGPLPQLPAGSRSASSLRGHGLWSADLCRKNTPAMRRCLAALCGFQNTQSYRKMTAEHSVLLSATGFVLSHLLFPQGHDKDGFFQWILDPQPKGL